MSEINYWNSVSARTTPTTNKDTQQSKLNNIQQQFNQQMYDLLLSSSNDPFLNSMNMNLHEGIFGDAIYDEAVIKKLDDMKHQGMEKVWAARMQSVLPFSNWDSDKEDNNNSGVLSSFGNIIELTIKMQVAQAKKQLQQLDSGSHLSLDEFIENHVVLDENDTAENHAQVSQRLFIDEMRNQLDDATEKFNVSLDELIAKILDKP